MKIRKINLWDKLTALFYELYKIVQLAVLVLAMIICVLVSVATLVVIAIILCFGIKWFIIGMKALMLFLYTLGEWAGFIFPVTVFIAFLGALYKFNNDRKLKGKDIKDTLTKVYKAKNDKTLWPDIAAEICMYGNKYAIYHYQIINCALTQEDYLKLTSVLADDIAYYSSIFGPPNRIIEKILLNETSKKIAKHARKTAEAIRQSRYNRKVIFRYNGDIVELS